DEAATQIERCGEDLPELLRSPEPRHEVEEVGDVGADLRVGCEEPYVLVDTRRRRVVVPGADVRVAAEHAAFSAYDECRLRVNLEIGKAVDHVHARLLERARPFDVSLLVEAR